MTPKRVAAVSALAALAAALLWLLRPPYPVPSFADLRAVARTSDVVFVDRNGVPVHELRADPFERSLPWVSLAEISPVFVATVETLEDRRFRSHFGVDAVALAGALRVAVRGGRLRGASTLTMQLATLLDPQPGATRRRTLWRKLRQMRAALALERRWSKDEILEAYLNRVTFRGELRGVAAAARGLFGVDPHGLDAEQSLVLATLLRSPNAEAGDVADRACALAARIPSPVSCDSVEDTAFRALLAGPGIEARVRLAPHLAHRLLAPSHSKRPRRIATTLDADLQRLAVDAVRRQIGALAPRNARDAAVIALDNRTGDVLAYVGSSGALSLAPHVDGVRAQRQAGSSLKPLLYAEALDARLVTPGSWLEDTPLELTSPVGAYAPRDYDESFRGLVRLRTALASSLNLPAVRTLELLGTARFVETLQRAGLTGLRPPEDYGPSLALGSADVKLEELANAYRALANGGVVTPLRFETAAPPAAGETRVVSPEAAFLVADILSDRGARSATFGLESSLATPFWSAVKTGTSKDMRDNWCLGFSSDYTVGVWVGNFSGAPMWHVTGVDGAAPIWLELMRRLHRDRPSIAPTPPPGVTRRDGEWYLAGTEPDRPAEPAPLESRGPRIRSPGEGAVVALDPEIPAPAQRLYVESEPPRADLSLRIDGAALGDAGAPRAWAPVSGAHEVELVDRDARVLDRVSFQVRE